MLGRQGARLKGPCDEAIAGGMTLAATVTGAFRKVVQIIFQHATQKSEYSVYATNENDIQMQVRIFNNLGKMLPHITVF